MCEMNLNLIAAMLDEPGHPRVHAGLDPAPDHGATSSQTPLGPAAATSLTDVRTD